jgi:hypothetical protein
VPRESLKVEAAPGSRFGLCKDAKRGGPAVSAVLGFFVVVSPALAGGRVLTPMDIVSIRVLDERT